MIQSEFLPVFWSGWSKPHSVRIDLGLQDYLMSLSVSEGVSLCVQLAEHSVPLGKGESCSSGFLFSPHSSAFIGLDECYKEETRCETGMTWKDR